MKRIFAHREIVPAILVIVAFIAGVIESPYFLDFRYLLDSSTLYIETGLLALGMTLVIVTGQIDLSVASTMALVACATAKMLQGHASPWIALPTGLILGTALGAINGVLVACLRLPSFLVTLATMAVYRGVAQVMLGSSSITIPARLTGIGFVKELGLPVPLLGLAVVAVGVGLVLHRTVLGRWIFTVGTNEKAADYSGVPTANVKIFVFALSGFMAGLAALLINSRLGVARFDDARGLELDVVTVVVLGGTSISGGNGSILGSMLALVLIGLIRTGMGLANVTAEYQLAAVGTLLVMAIVIANLAAKKRVN
jgi:rhamnose transport system permease protein